MPADLPSLDLPSDIESSLSSVIEINDDNKE